MAKSVTAEAAAALAKIGRNDLAKRLIAEEGTLYAVTVYTYESNDYPILAHTFIGKTENEARSYLEAHKKTDEFFAGCEDGQWEDVECTNTDPKVEKIKISDLPSK